MFSTAWWAMFANENSIAAIISTANSPPMRRFDGVAVRLALPGFGLEPKRKLVVRFARRCIRRRASSQTARPVPTAVIGPAPAFRR
jgi:hypothetical protein